MRHTLLLADDSVTIQRVIELTFADEDVEVVAVSDGDDAIARIEASPPDIVLADIGMPGKNGYEVARYIKQSPRLSHIPVVLLTGAFEPIDQMRAAEAGCDGILAKPFEPQLVIERVNDLLTRPGGAGAKRPGPLPPPAAAAAPSEDLGEYFDRLDAAFANLSAAGGPPPAAAPPPPADDSGALPPLADAFAALLAAEQREHAGTDARIWPGTEAPAPTVTDDDIERIVSRVLARLSDQVVRQTVADVVGAIAERLVREEIDRIKGSMQ